MTILEENPVTTPAPEEATPNVHSSTPVPAVHGSTLVPAKMDPVFKSRWLTALRSGEYQQGTGCLRSYWDEYCCLGVAADLLNPQGWAQPEVSDTADWKNVYEGSSSVGSLPLPLRDHIGMAESQTCELMNLNDGGHSFAMIADYIERYL